MQKTTIMNIFRNIILILFALCITQVVAAQTVLTGKVTDVKNEPLMGSNIYVLNLNNRTLAGCMANENGEYRLVVPSGEKVKIVFSYIGYKTQILEYAGQATINVALEEESQQIDAVEIVGKRVERNMVGLTAREQVSATQRITLERLETAPVTNITDALQGALSNVDVLTGADPGSKASIRIRGTSSLNASSEPLIVVDGVPYPVDISSDFNFATATSDDYSELLNISPTDIESVEVLKDAAATAVWGSKGANGVLLFKTKKGTKGKIRFTASSKYEIRKEANTIPLLNAKQYVSLMQDAIWNTVNDLGASSSSSITYLNLLFNTNEIGFDPDWVYFKEYNQDTKWLDEITKTAYSVDNNFSMSGGGDKATYRLSLGYARDEGITIGTQYDRINALFSVQYKFSDNLDVSTDIKFTQGRRDANWDNPRGEALNKMPNMSPYTIGTDGLRTSEYFTPNSYFQGTFSVKDNNKDIDGRFNPVALAKEAINNTTSNNSRVLFNLHYRFFRDLNYYGIIGIDATSDKTKKFLPQEATGVTYTDEWFNRSLDGLTDKTVVNTENRLIYNKNIGEAHKFLLAGIFQTREQITSAYSSEVSGNASSSISDPVTGVNIQGMGSGKSTTRELAGIFNAHYSLLDRYMFDAGYRVEANSSIGHNSRVGGFPTLGVAWLLGDEKFMDKLPVVSLAKIRLSWGQSGNTPGGSYPYIGIVSPIVPGYINMNAIQPVSIQLDNLTWETVTQTNLGIDGGLFENKLTFSIDIYNKVTTNLLQKDVKLPTSTGFASVKYFNSGKMSNKGWELRIDWDAIQSPKFGLQINLNMAQNKNKVEDLPGNLLTTDFSFANGEYASRIVVGDPLGSFYGFKCLGVYQNVDETYAHDSNGNLITDINDKQVIMRNGNQTVYPGDAKYQDMNNDGVIDQYDIVYLGNAMPKTTGGFGFNLRYMNLGLVGTFQGRLGQKIVNQARINMENMYGTSNQSVAVLRRWRNEGDDTNIPRALYDKGYNYLGSDRFVEDGSFLRMKTLTLKYSLPKAFIQKAGITRVDVYATAYDLLTLTKYKGQDPEVGISGNIYLLAQDKAVTPKPIRVAFGVSLNF